MNGIFHDTGLFNNHQSPPDRWTALSRETGILVKPYRNTGRHVLLLGQVPTDASLCGTDIYAWIGDTARDLRCHTDRPILVRPHPASSREALAGFRERIRETRGLVLDDPPRGDMRHALRSCWAVVTHSSSGMVDALVNGIPGISMSRASIAWPVTDHCLAAIEQPTLHDREQWLHDLAYAQWSLSEMESGEVWRHLGPTLARLARPIETDPAPL